jgi:polyphosphate kinase 2
MPLYALESDPEYIQLQTEFVRLQQHIKDNNLRVVIIFEGRDTAGKGGAIMRFIRFLNPRLYRVVALSKPTEVERGEWYFQRYIYHLPGPGEIVFFDRSWYNRAVVEPVMEFCTVDQYDLFNQQVIQLEKMLSDDGMQIFKLWFSIDIEEQKFRLDERRSNPLKQWKLSTVDAQAQAKWDEFTKYKELMFDKTSTPQCPWIVIKGNDRERARIEAMRCILSQLSYAKKGETGVSLIPDEEIITFIKGKGSIVNTQV